MDTADLEEMFAGLGEVSVRRMFGGQGVYHGGLIVAIVFVGEVLLKSDAVCAPSFEAAGARRWVYSGHSDRTVGMPYWTIPDDAYDDPDQMARWVRLAYEAALRSPPKTPRKPKAKS
jgi:DNA transformation protein